MGCGGGCKNKKNREGWIVSGLWGKKGEREKKMLLIFS